MTSAGNEENQNHQHSGRARRQNANYNKSYLDGESDNFTDSGSDSGDENSEPVDVLVLDKLLARRRVQGTTRLRNGPLSYEYLCKWKTVSYRHLDWFSENEVKDMGLREKNMITRFNNRLNQICTDRNERRTKAGLRPLQGGEQRIEALYDDEDDDDLLEAESIPPLFDPRYIVVERILCAKSMLADAPELPGNAEKVASEDPSKTQGKSTLATGALLNEMSTKDGISATSTMADTTVTTSQDGTVSVADVLPNEMLTKEKEDVSAISTTIDNAASKPQGCSIPVADALPNDVPTNEHVTISDTSTSIHDVSNSPPVDAQMVDVSSTKQPEIIVPSNNLPSVLSDTSASTPAKEIPASDGQATVQTAEQISVPASDISTKAVTVNSETLCNNLNAPNTINQIVAPVSVPVPVTEVKPPETVVDKIAHKEPGQIMRLMYLVKWTGLPYIESTWEWADDVQDERTLSDGMIEKYRRENEPPKNIQPLCGVASSVPLNSAVGARILSKHKGSSTARGGNAKQFPIGYMIRQGFHELAQMKLSSHLGDPGPMTHVPPSLISLLNIAEATCKIRREDDILAINGEDARGKDVNSLARMISFQMRRPGVKVVIRFRRYIKRVKGNRACLHGTRGGWCPIAAVDENGESVDKIEVLDFDVTFPKHNNKPLGLGLTKNPWSNNCCVGYFLPPWYYGPEGTLMRKLGYFSGGCPSDYNAAVRDAVVMYMQQGAMTFPTPHPQLIAAVGESSYLKQVGLVGFEYELVTPIEVAKQIGIPLSEFDAWLNGKVTFSNKQLWIFESKVEAWLLRATLVWQLFSRHTLTLPTMKALLGDTSVDNDQHLVGAMRVMHDKIVILLSALDIWEQSAPVNSSSFAVAGSSHPLQCINSSSPSGRACTMSEVNVSTASAASAPAPSSTSTLLSSSECVTIVSQVGEVMDDVLRKVEAIFSTEQYSQCSIDFSAQTAFAKQITGAQGFGEDDSKLWHKQSPYVVTSCLDGGDAEDDTRLSHNAHHPLGIKPIVVDVVTECIDSNIFGELILKAGKAGANMTKEMFDAAVLGAAELARKTSRENDKITSTRDIQLVVGAVVAAARIAARIDAKAVADEAARAFSSATAAAAISSTDTGITTKEAKAATTSSEGMSNKMIQSNLDSTATAMVVKASPKESEAPSTALSSTISKSKSREMQRMFILETAYRSLKRAAIRHAQSINSVRVLPTKIGPPSIVEIYNKMESIAASDLYTSPASITCRNSTATSNSVKSYCKLPVAQDFTEAANAQEDRVNPEVAQCLSEVIMQCELAVEANKVNFSWHQLLAQPSEKHSHIGTVASISPVLSTKRHKHFAKVMRCLVQPVHFNRKPNLYQDGYASSVEHEFRQTEANLLHQAGLPIPNDLIKIRAYRIKHQSKEHARKGQMSNIVAERAAARIERLAEKQQMKEIAAAARLGPRIMERAQMRRINALSERGFTPYTDITMHKYKNQNRLRPYQLEGVNWLIGQWYRRRSCILADEMGLGKTVQVVATLQHIVSQDDVRGPFLVVVPLSTIGHWKREFERWTDMTVCVYYEGLGGGAKGREQIRMYEWWFDKLHNRRDVPKFNVLITTYETFVTDSDYLSEISWVTLVVDEGHRIRSAKSKLLALLQNLEVHWRLLLTGTPLQNNTQELWSLMNFCDSVTFSDLDIFMSEFGSVETSTQLEQLQRVIAPFMLRRIKEDVEKTIPPKEETIVDVELTMLQKRYYRAIYEKNRSFLYRGCKASNKPQLINVEMELRKCCNHPFLIRGVHDKEMEECLAQGQDPARRLVESSGKLVLVDKLLPKLRKENHKVLIFSQMVRMLDILEQHCHNSGYPVERLDGSVQGSLRQASIDRYSNNADLDKAFVFLLSTRAGGLGINLTAADTVIIFDSDWNPQNDAQAQARCHRIGQDKAVRIYRLVTKNTYEETMLQRAAKKLGLERAVLGHGSKDSGRIGNGVGGKEMSSKELEAMLRQGAYYHLMNDTEEDEDAAQTFCAADIDQLLAEHSRIIKVEPIRGGITSITHNTVNKSSFSLRGRGKSGQNSVDLHDPDFWSKVLPDFTSPDTLMARLVDGSALTTPATRNTFIGTHVKNLVEGILKQREDGDVVEPYVIDATKELLIRIVSMKETVGGDKASLAATWLTRIEESKERRRRVKTVFTSPSDLGNEKKSGARNNDSKKRRYGRYGREGFSYQEESDSSDYEGTGGVQRKKRGRKVGKRRRSRMDYNEDNGSGDEWEPEKSSQSFGLYSDDEDGNCDDREIDFNTELCAICADGGTLVICEGPCKRAFHFDCLMIPDSEKGKDDEAWFCPDCASQKHRCLLCGTIGVYDPPKQETNEVGSANDIHVENEDAASSPLGSPSLPGNSANNSVPAFSKALERVYKCSEALCGKFYHLECLQAHDLVIWHSSSQATSSSSKITTPNFTCPLHTCSACFQPGGVSVQCIRCERGFHVKCMDERHTLRLHRNLAICPAHLNGQVFETIRQTQSTLAKKKGAGGRRKMRCGVCAGCLSKPCLNCKACLDRPENGGPGKLKRACELRKCVEIHPKYSVSSVANTRKSKRARRSSTRVSSKTTRGLYTDGSGSDNYHDEEDELNNGRSELLHARAREKLSLLPVGWTIDGTIFVSPQISGGRRFNNLKQAQEFVRYEENAKPGGSSNIDEDMEDDWEISDVGDTNEDVTPDFPPVNTSIPIEAIMEDGRQVSVRMRIGPGGQMV